ncbi:MAG: PAS domain S-box protein [Planctomycetes bacterium]|nr:PAS domain S-box protein [Planctomycetota bacterium]
MADRSNRSPESPDPEQKLRNERQFSEAMIESMPGILYFYDGQGRFLRWNRNFETVSGYSSEEIGRMHPLEFFSGADKARVEERIAEVFALGESSVEAAFVAKDGAATPFFFTGRRVLFEGRPCLVGVGIDNSERKRAEIRIEESERKYRELVENANSIILRWNAAGRMTFLNEFGQRFFGYSSDEIVGRHVLETIVPPTETQGRDLKQLMEEICAAPESFEQNINENIKRNGERVWIAWTNRIVRDAHGQVAEILSIGTDITGRRRLEEQLRQSQKMDAVGRLAGGVAHDFNNLLTIISGYSQILLQSKAADPKALEKIKAISDAAGRAATLTRQLLGFSRQSILQPKILDLNAVVADTGKMLRRLIGEAVRFTTVLTPNLSKVKVDPGQLDQVLMNLAVNARDAMMPQGGQLTVETGNVLLDGHFTSTHLKAKLGPHVMLAVSDTGCGMKKEVLSRIFEPFYTTKGVGKGTGLGLSMVLGIVEQSGGCIHVYSEPGLGTTFKIFFPAVADEAAQEAAAPAISNLQGTETILLVEDEESVRALTTMSLQSLGYKVLVAVDGKDALSVARAQGDTIDLVVTDVVMPNLGGPEMAAQLKPQFPRMKVLYMSGYTDDAVVRHGLLQDTLALLQKPYTPISLAQKVRQVLDTNPTQPAPPL